MIVCVDGGIHTAKIGGGSMMRAYATSITAEVVLDNSGSLLTIYYCIDFSDDSQLNDKLKVTYPVSLTGLIDLSLVHNYVQIFLSQMFLMQGKIKLFCSKNDIQNYSNIIKALYAIRNYQEGASIQTPEIDWIPHYNDRMIISTQQPKVLNLVSGGKDSLISDILLEKNNAYIKRCFFSGLNIEATVHEKDACKYLYDDFDEIELNGFDVLVNKLIALSSCYGNPPVNNSIPKGRDLLTIIFAYPLAVYFDCEYISHGCEKDLWEKILVKDETEIPMHDSQCKLAMVPMSEQMYKSTGIRIFSPIAGMHEIYLLTWLMKNRPNSIQKMQSCFYGQWCGKCIKCLRYYLVQKHAGVDIIKFKSNPEHQLHSLIDKLGKPNAHETIGYYEELKFLTGLSKYEKELFTPTYCNLFPSFFERWVLE